MDGGNVSRASRSSDSGRSLSSTLAEILAFSSLAVRSINMNAIMPAGSTPSVIRPAKRCATTSVFPEPAEAMTCR